MTEYTSEEARELLLSGKGKGMVIEAGGSLNLYGLTKLPEGLTLSAGGYLDLGNLTTLPEGVTLSASGCLYLESLTTLAEGVTLSVGDSLDLSSVTTLPEGVTLSARGYLDLSSLTTVPEGVTLSAGYSLYLDRLTTLPEGVTLSAGAQIDLPRMTTEEQVYQGKKIRLRTIDRICTRLISKRKVGGVTLWSAQYFKGNLYTDRRCYVAHEGDVHAHGDTAELALRDLRFKIAQADFDPSELAETIRKRGTVTFNDYRLITGACESGLIEGLKARGVDPDVEELPLQEVIDLCRDGYGGSTFIKAVGELK